MAEKPTYEDMEERIKELEKEVSNRRDFEENFSHSNKIMVDILESISDGFFALDDNFIVIYFNNAAEKLLGRKREAVLGQNLFDAFPEAKGSIFDKKYTQGVKEKQFLCFETFFGTEPYANWYDVRAYPQKNGISVFFQVTTERKQVEEALRESEKQFRSLLEQSPVSIEILAPDGRLNLVNSAFMKMWGISRKALPKVYEKYNILKDEQVRELGVMPLIEKAFAGEAVILPPIEYDALIMLNTIGFTEVEGKKRWVQVLLYPVKNKNGEIINVVLMEEDITDRKRAEEALQKAHDELEQRVKDRTIELREANKELHFEIKERKQTEDALQESESRFRSLSDASFEGIIITEKSRIIEVNNTMSTMFGYSTSELISKSAIDFVDPEMREDVQGKMMSGYENFYESNGLRKDGSIFPVEVHARIFTHKGRNVRVTAIRDITERKQAEEEIKKLQGLLPICANCKKIRDEKGYWRQIESYIVEHSEAEFTHGICKECSDKLYGDQEWYQKVKKGTNNKR